MYGELLTSDGLGGCDDTVSGRSGEVQDEPGKKSAIRPPRKENVIIHNYFIHVNLLTNRHLTSAGTHL